MRIEKLILENFGPFQNYELDFPAEEGVSLLLVGKNNEGKSTILSALKILSDSTKVIGKSKYRLSINDEPFYGLLKQDVGDIRIGRLIYNYGDEISKITGIFSNNFQITAFLDPQRDIIYADYLGRLPSDINSLMGFIPPLGPISEHEEVLSNINYLKANINTSLAPRHLRNYYYQLLTPQQFQLVKKIVNSSWTDIELDSFDLIIEQNQLECFYKENGILREISWAGQGLQVWFQIITHLVLLLDRQIIILDEPEVNLHPEKQNELINIIRQYHSGSVIIATHSIELMNNVNISHIINTKKNQNKPSIKITTDRKYLEEVRANIGSNFNFVASQFEEVNNIIFTEDLSDYAIISELLGWEFLSNSFNIPLYGFQQYYKAKYFKEAYEILLGKQVNCLVILDRDYYPDEYLANVENELNKSNINVVFTDGKEIENYFIHPDIYEPICEESDYNNFINWFWALVESKKLECLSDYTGIVIQYSKRQQSENTTLKKYLPLFEEKWCEKTTKINLIPGKQTIGLIRKYFKDMHNLSLSNTTLINLLINCNTGFVNGFISRIKEKTI